MLVNYFLSFKVVFILFDIDFFKNIFKSTIILLQNGIFGTQIKGKSPFQSIGKARVSKINNAAVCIMHG